MAGVSKPNLPKVSVAKAKKPKKIKTVKKAKSRTVVLGS